MANRNFPQNKTFGFHLLPARIRGSITIGSTGAVSSFSAPGVNTITRMGTGVYRIQLQDNYASFLHANFSMIGQSVTGSDLDPNTGAVGTLYEITIIGTTNWVTAGIPSGITPAVGQVFALAAAPTAGTGRVKVSVRSNITDIQLAGNPNSGFMNKQPFQAGSGGYVTICTLAPTSSSVTTEIPADPTSGDIVLFDILCNSSQVQ